MAHSRPSLFMPVHVHQLRRVALGRGLYSADMKSAIQSAPAGKSLADLPRRIFLDSCTAQTLGTYGGAIHEGEPIPENDRIHEIPDGIANVEALARIFRVNERAMFEWIVSEASLQEASDKQDRRHMQWLFDIAD